MGRSRHGSTKSKQWINSYLPKLLIAVIALGAIAGGAYFVTRKTPQDHLQAGVALHAKGDLKGAAIELKNALQSMPNNADARFRLGSIHFVHTEYQSAEKELKRARDLGMRDDTLDTLYARTLLILNEPQRLLDEVTAAEDSSAETKAGLLALRGRAQLMLKDDAAGEQSLNDADAILPEHPETLITRALIAFRDKHADLALSLVDKAVSKAPARVDFILLKGDLLHTLKQDELAKAAYSSVLDLEPANVPARLARVRIYMEASDLEQAGADLRELKKYAPQDVMGRYFEAFLAFRQARYAESNDILQGILRGSPDFMPGHLLAGTVNIALGNREAARFHLDKVLGVAPQHPLARKLMAATLADMGDMDKAKELLASFGDANDDALLNSLQGRIALRQGDYSEARKHLEQVEAEGMHDAKFYTELASSRMGSGDSAGAVEALNKAAELDTESSRPDVLLVMTHLKDNHFADALKVIDRMDKEHPDSALAHNLRGVVFLRQSDFPKARSSFAKALEVQSDFFPAAANLALLDVRDKDLGAARSRFKQVLKVNAKESRAWFALAGLDAREGNESGYLANLEQAKKTNEKAYQPRVELIRYWLRKKEAGKALVEARSALDSTGRQEFNEFIGLALSAQGDHTNALATYKKWVDGNPKNALAWFRLAQEQIAAKDQSGALSSLDKALALQTNFLEARVSKALLLGQMGRSDEGIKIARGVQGQQPKAAVGFLTEAEILFARKQYAEAAALFSKSATLAAQGQALVRAYQAYSLAGKAPEGEKLLAQWVKTHPSDAAVRHQYALVLLNAKRLGEAAEQYRVLVKAGPKDMVAHNNLAWLLGELRDKDAVAVAEQAYKLNPNNPAMQDTLGWILVNNGQSKRGLELLRQALSKSPDAAEIHWHLAAALAKTGDTARARQELERLFSSGLAFPQEAEAKKLLETLK